MERQNLNNIDKFLNKKLGKQKQNCSFGRHEIDLLFYEFFNEKWIDISKIPTDNTRVLLTNGKDFFTGSNYKGYWNLEENYQDEVPTSFRFIYV